MTFTSVFGGTVVYPAEVSYRAVSLTADTELSWPTELATDTNVVAKIMNVTATAGPWDLILPPADQASVGETTLIFNVGSNDFIVTDNGGNTIVSIAPGLAYQLFLTGNTTPNGVWGQVQYGAGTSSATAGSLAGLGVKAIGTSLNQSMSVTTISLNYSFAVATDRSQMFVWTGGAGTLTLPLAANAGNDWFVQIRNNGTGAITLAPSGSDQINGAASLVFNPGDSAIIACSGSAWFSVGFGQSTSFTFDYDSIDLTAETTPFTLTGANLNRIAYNFGGTIASNYDIIVPATIQQYWVTNGTTGGFDVVIKTASGTGISIAAGESAILYCDGVNVVDADTSGVAFPISIANGGTGATNTTNARTNLNAAKDGVNADITRITALSDGGASGPAVTFLSESNTGIYRSGAGALSVAIGGALTATFSATGLNLASGDAFSIAGNSVLNATTLGSGVVNSSLTSVGTLTSGALGAGFTTVAVAQGGTGVTTSTGTGSVVLSTSPTLVTPTLGAASATSITNGLGAVGTPSYTFTGDTNTGMWSPAADTVAVSTAGSERARVDNAGRVILGHTSSLSVAGRTSLLQTYTANLYTGARYNSASSAGANFSFARSRSATPGSFGVVSANDAIASINFSGDDGSAFVDAASIIASVDGTPGTGDMPGRLQFLTTADGAASPTERMRIDSSGNVGIGTSSPISNLHVNSTGNTLVRITTSFANSVSTGLYIDQPGDSAAGRIAFAKSSANRGAILFRHNASAASEQMEFNVAGSNVIEAAYSQTLFRSNNVERMRITSAGNVGIGTSAPTDLLHLSKGAGLGIILERTGGTPSVASISNSANLLTLSTNAHGGLSFNTGSTPAERARFDPNGNFLFATTTSSASSTANGLAVLQSNSSILSRRESGASQTHVNFVNGGSSVGTIVTSTTAATYNTSGTSGITGVDANTVAIRTNSTERMRVDSSGNVGVGTASPNAAARLDVSSTTSGFLPPRMTEAQRDLIATPPNGLMLYNTTTNKLQVRAASAWVDLH